MNKLYFIFLLLLPFSFLSKVNAHSVQVGYCTSCNGDLRIWVEHWHSTENPNSTTMTLDVTINGVTTSQTGSPNTGVQNTPLASLPGCTTPITIFGSCNQANTYNDWVAYDFPNMPIGVPITITIISGNTVFTQDGCNMYPASTGTIIIAPPPTVSNVTTCAGQQVGPMNLPPTGTWTNSNPAIGLPASGTGDINFFPTNSTTTQTANITLSNTCGTSSFTITVYPAPISNFTAPGIGPGLACPNQLIQFTNNSTPAPGSTLTGYTWDFGDGSPTSNLQNPTHTFPVAPNFFNVTLTVTDAAGCTDSTILTINFGDPSANFTAPDVCDGNPVIFTDTSIPLGTVTNWGWDFQNDGIVDNTTANPNYTFPGPGTYYIELHVTADGGCKDSIVYPVVVFYNPVAGFNFSDVCDGNSVNFTNTSTVNMATSITNYAWDFGDGNTSTVQSPSHLYATIGIYNVSLTVTTADGCTDVFTATVNVFPVPVSSFTVNDVCLSDQAMFTNTSTGPITSWEWDFGDGSPLNTTVQNPSHFYPVAGNYTVILVNFSLNCSDTVMVQVEIFPMPIADFNFTNECFGDPNVFTDMSQGNQDWAWDFGDGVGVSAVQNPTYTYANPGNYNVTLIVTTGNNCTDTITKNVLVYALPVSQFSVDDVCLINPAIFNNSSSGSISTWTWNFGDGSPIDNTSQNPIHFYPSAGTYTVTLINNSIGGCADTAIVNVVIFPMPVANFSFTNVCLNEPTVFTDLSSGSNLSWGWDFNNDGIVDNTSASPSHIYSSPGSHLVTLTVTTPEGCIDIMQQTITVYPLPVTLFSAASVCHGTNTVFQNNSYIGPPDNIPSWQWNFDDASPIDTVQAPVYLYNTPGTYNVELLITSNNGCQDSLTVPVTVHPNPVVDFQPDSIGCSPLCIGFQDMSNVLTGSNQEWLWDFGDGATSDFSNPAHCYINNTNFIHLIHTVSLTVTSDQGCSTLKVKNNYITVNPLPIADFNYSPQPTTITHPIIYFEDQSVESYQWQWNFGDYQESGVSSEQNPYYTYIDTGSFVVTLIAENNYGCTDTIEQTVVIGPDWIIYVPNAFTPNDDGINDLFFAKGYGILEYELMIFDRWGEMIFTTTNMDEGWDGTVRGNSKFSQEEVYVYLIKFRNIHHKPDKLRGTVTIIR